MALGEEKKREFLIRMACDFQDSTALAEENFINQVCAKVAMGQIGIALPASATQAALTILTDEYFHIFAEKEFISDVCKYTGIKFSGQAQQDSSVARSFVYLKQNVSPDVLCIAEVVALCFYENFVTQELFGLTSDTKKDNPFHTALREHLEDEGRHSGYFEKLLAHVWSVLDSNAKTELGEMLPGFLDLFLIDKSYILQVTGHLTAMGLAQDIVEEIRQEMIANTPEPSFQKNQLFNARKPLRLLAQAGLTAHAPTRQALVQSGWLQQ